MHAHQPIPAFDQAMQFLYQAHGNAISEDLVESYCRRGLMADVEGRLMLTDEGRAELRRARQRTAPAMPAHC